MPDTAKVIEDLLSHHGVKGMHWGVRRKATVGPQEVIISDKRKKIKTSGGRGHPATEEAISSRKIGQIGNKSGPKALTNKQLEEYNKRLNLEQNFSRLSYNQKSRGAKFVDQVLGRQGSQLANKAAQEGATYAGRQALNAATRKSARLAATIAVA